MDDDLLGTNTMGENLFGSSSLFKKNLYLFTSYLSFVLHIYTKRLHILKMSCKETVETQNRQDKTKHAPSEMSSHPFINLHDPLFSQNIFFPFFLYCVMY